ncbi:MAG: homoserine dehydrogenase [Candidatus Omnitrophica bacterium]|nr:homoserine dehydrogenase [Candidatus Omnitrophota bacterium]
MIKKIGIIGLGTVGQATVKSIKKYSSLAARRTSVKISIKGVCDADSSKRKIAKKLSIPFVSDAKSLINDPEIDTIVELIGGINPAKNFIMDSLNRGKCVVTANKALLAKHGKEIFALAKKVKKSVGFEASVCGAIPIIKSISQGLVCCDIKKIHGILNGTTNYILYKMGQTRADFYSVLREAQEKGLAEKNPHFDIDGIDSLHKLCILSYICFGVWPTPEKVYAQGISKISLLDIVYAEELNYRIKLLAIAKKEKNSLDLRVHPALVPIGHSLSEVSLAYNAVHLDTAPAGELLFEGVGAGGVATSSAVISDIIGVSLGTNECLKNTRELSFQDIKNIKTRYYIRLMAKDEPGVLAKVSKILANFKISIASVKQKERNKEKLVPVIMLTHDAREENLAKAMRQIDQLSVIKNPSQIIRIEDL